MPRRTDRSALIDNILRLGIFGGLTLTALLAPNAIQLFDRPVQAYLKKLDRAAQLRELKKTWAYMKHHSLITEEYEHGIAVSPRAIKRLQGIDFDAIDIPIPQLWDKKWRIVIFDIPESKRSARNAFAAKLRDMGFILLQRSVLVHPFPCKTEIALISSHLNLAKYVSYFTVINIDNASVLKRKFKNLLN